eukprot:1344073-Amphidinium_carterae.1
MSNNGNCFKSIHGKEKCSHLRLRAKDRFGFNGQQNPITSKERHLAQILDNSTRSGTCFHFLFTGPLASR